MLAVGAITAAIVPVAGSPSGAATGVTPTDDALAMGRSLSSNVAWITGASFVARPATAATGLVTAAAGFPLSGSTASILSTGNVTLIEQPNSATNSGTNLNGPSQRGNTDYDVTILKVDLMVPQTANCLLGLDFQSFSEEYPEYVGSSFNDAFIAEVDSSTWTTSGSTISAPNNFAFDPTGNPITINAAGKTSMTAESAAGTAFDGATPKLTAATPLAPGAHSLYLSIFDQGDHIYDSAVIVDNLRLGHVANVATDCKPGAVEVIDNRRYVALGDSYSAGFGVSPYLVGTNKDAGPNDCQRSTRAYSQSVAARRGLQLDFHACQGALTKDFLQPRNSTWGEQPQVVFG